MSDVPAAAYVVVFGGYITALVGRSFYFGWASQQWPRVDAMVASSEVAIADVANPRRGWGRNAVNLEAMPHIVYSYQVRARTYWGDRVHFGPEMWWYAASEVRRYPPDSVIEIAYDPREPKRSTIRPGVTWTLALAMPVAFAIFVTGVTWLVRSL
jgi:hypothetical protein